MNKFYIIILLFILGGIYSLHAQDKWEKEEKPAALSDEAIYIEKNRKITLPRVSRSFRKIQLASDKTDSLKLNYTFEDLYLPLEALSTKIRVSKIKPDPLSKLYPNYIKGGLGTLNSTYLQGGFANKRNRNTSIGLNFRHEGFGKGPKAVAVDRNDVTTYSQFLNPYLEWKNNKVALKSEIYYQRTANKLYGLDSTQLGSEDTFQLEKRNFNLIGANVGLTDRNRDDNYRYQADIDAYFLNSNYNSREVLIDFNLQNSLELSSNLKTKLSLNGFTSSYSAQSRLLQKNRSLIRLSPVIQFSKWDMLIDAGLNVIYENDTLPKMNQVHLYPVLSARYPLLNNAEVTVGLRADVDRVLFRDVFNTNPFLDTTIPIQNTLNTFNFYGKIDYLLTSKIGLQAGFSIKRLRNNLIFLADTVDGVFNTSFIEEGNSQSNFHLSVFSTINEVFFATVRADYTAFDLGEDLNMPYRPNFTLRSTIRYTLARKLTIGLDADIQGRMYEGFISTTESTFLSTQEKSLPAIFNLDLSANYKLTERASAFINASNIINQEYEYFSNYPNRGLRLMIGFQYAF